MPIAALDACVLYQGMLTDLLLWLAEGKVFEPLWSDEITDEWSRHLADRLPKDKIAYRREQMGTAFPAANVPADTKLLNEILAMCRTDKHRKDAHVIATAVAAKANFIVTHNIPDFDANILEHYGLIKWRPDVFCVELLKSNPDQVLKGVSAHRASLKKSNPSQDAYLAAMAEVKFGLPKFAKSLAPFKADI